MIVDLAPLRTLFPRSITFDCQRTKGGRLLILERVLSDWVRGGGCFFAKTALPRVKQEGGEVEKKSANVEHQSDMAACLSDIGFHIINL